MHQFRLSSFLLPLCGVANAASFYIPSSLLTTASLWAADVSQVTNFLDEANQIPTEMFSARASTALAFEKEELKRKAILDQALGGESSIQSANNTLVTQGTFDMVVQLLEQLVENGKSGVGTVDQINKVRCTEVLPAIDVYFRTVIGMNPGAKPIVASRPEQCSQFM